MKKEGLNGRVFGITPMGSLNPEGEEVVKGIIKHNFKRLACNRCTGVSAGQKAIELRHTVVKDNARYGSRSKSDLGNGDEIVLG